MGGEKQVWRFEPSYFDRPGRWVRACFHCHTVNSDGGMTPEETVRLYRGRGYDCLGITDHRQVTPSEVFSDDEFIGINSIENGGNPDIIGVGAVAPVERSLPLAERARLLAEQGAFTIGAHPTYCGVTPDIYLGCPDLMAMEIYNAYCDQAYTNGIATELWDMVLGGGKRIWGVAGDDAHLNMNKRFYSDAGLAWVEIWTGELSREAILEALKGGSFYSTQGPEFRSISVRGRAIRIECSPVLEVRWRTFGSTGFVDYPPRGGYLTSSALPEWFTPRGYVRIELVDGWGRRAWSNPFFVEPA